MDHVRPERRPECSPCGHAQRVCRGKLEQPRSAGKRDTRRRDGPEPRLARREIARPEGGRAAIGEPEVGDGLGERLVHEPAAGAEERRRQSLRLHPLHLAPRAVGVLRAGRRGPSLLGRDEVRVQAERPSLRSLVGAVEPALLVLACLRRPHQRCDPEAAGTGLLQRGESGPARIVEWTLDVTGNDRDAAHRGQSDQIPG